MLHLSIDYIYRHPFTLGFVFLMSLVWGGGTVRDLGDSPLLFMIAQMAVFSFYGLMLDLPKGYLRVLGMLPLSSQEVVKTLWVLGVCLGPCIVLVGYWMGALLHVIVGAVMGYPWIPGVRFFFVLAELLICTIVVGWTSFVISGDPTKANWSKGLLGWVFGLLWIWPMFIPKDWLKVLYDLSPYTVLPVILSAGMVSYLVTPLILTSGPSLSWPGGRARPSRKVVHPIIFPSRWMALLRALVSPMLRFSLMMGIGTVVWYGIMVLQGPRNHSENFVHSFGIMMMTMMVLFIFGFGVVATGIMRGLRVLPVSTNKMAWVMTLLPLEVWAAFGLIVTLMCKVFGQWPVLIDVFPLLILFAGVTSLFLALLFRYERVVPLYLAAIASITLANIMVNMSFSTLQSCGICLPLALVCFGLAYALNRDSLRYRNTLYHPRVIFGQIARQPCSMQTGWK